MGWLTRARVALLVVDPKSNTIHLLDHLGRDTEQSIKGTRLLEMTCGPTRFLCETKPLVLGQGFVDVWRRDVRLEPLGKNSLGGVSQVGPSLKVRIGLVLYDCLLLHAMHMSDVQLGCALVMVIGCDLAEADIHDIHAPFAKARELQVGRAGTMTIATVFQDQSFDTK